MERNVFGQSAVITQKCFCPILKKNTLAWPLGFIILQQGIGNAAVSQKAVKPTTIVNSSLDESRGLRSHSQGS